MRRRAALPIDPGLLERFRAAEPRIRWATVPGTAGSLPRTRARAPPSRSVRIARLGDERARVEERAGPSMVVESGPVGALVLLLHIDRNGGLPCLTSLAGGVDPAYPDGAIVARWSRGGRPTLSVGDLVEVARYALP